MSATIARKKAAFTLLELLCVIAIIALLASLLMPAIQDVRKQADSVACFANLRQIGIAVNLYLADHDNTYPYIETDPAVMQLYPPEIQAHSMAETLQPYGLTATNLKCPSDVKDADRDYFSKKGTSYEWRPMVDGEAKANIEIFTPRGVFHASPARLRIVTDYTAVHHEHMNALYADGHAIYYK